jgi:hypothetical protein
MKPKDTWKKQTLRCFNSMCFVGFYRHRTCPMVHQTCNSVPFSDGKQGLTQWCSVHTGRVATDSSIKDYAWLCAMPKHSPDVSGGALDMPTALDVSWWLSTNQTCPVCTRRVHMEPHQSCPMLRPGLHRSDAHVSAEWRGND